VARGKGRRRAAHKLPDHRREASRGTNRRKADV